MTIHGTITTLAEFDALVGSIRQRRAVLGLAGLPFRFEFYRGHADATWHVVSGIARQLPTDDAVRDADKAIMEHFRQRMTEKNLLHTVFLHEHPMGFQQEWAWYMQAQHYRVPTRLLDWTGKPEVALFFAVENGANDAVDGAFYVYYNPHSQLKIEGGPVPQYFETGPEDMMGTWFMNPAFELADGMDGWIAEARRARQFGKFSLQDYTLCRIGLDLQSDFVRGYGETVELDIPVIEKYLIPAAFKPQLRLDMIGRDWHGQWLYKDEDPVINEIRSECVQILADRVAAAGH